MKNQSIGIAQTIFGDQIYFAWTNFQKFTTAGSV